MAWNWPSKATAEVLDYGFNWSQALGADVISSSSWSVSDASLVVDSNTFTPFTSTVWLSAGTPNTAYSVTNLITTAAGRTFEQVASIRVTSA